MTRKHPGTKRPTFPHVTRRAALRTLGIALATSPLTQLLACDDDTTASTGADAGTDADASTDTAATDAGTGTDASLASSSGADATTTESDATTADDSDADTSDVAWATGGTAAMVDIDSYPDPFEAITDTTCALTCNTIVGPCYDSGTMERVDISEEKEGLPMRLGLRIVDDSCNPVTDANVDIWHCDVRGIYSGNDTENLNVEFCTENDAEAIASLYFRGYQQTDSDGIVWFNSCFPGWYSSRAIHIHLRIRRPDWEGDAYAVTQFGFQDTLISELCTSHPDYEARGLPDTANDSDTVFPADSVDDYLVETQKMTDGTLLAWKTLVIRSSLDDEVCGDTDEGPSGGGGPGGAPPSM